MLLRTIPLLLGFALIPARGAAEQPELGLVLHFDSRPSAAFVRTMEQELAAVIPVFHIHWLTSGGNPPETVYSREVTITFHGSCTGGAPGAHLAPALRRVTLGDTLVSDGAILPFSEIDCDRLRDFLDSADDVQTGDVQTGRESRLGRATGRVLAHELYHVLLQTREHSKKGIGKAVHSPAALLSRSLRFEEGELELISARYR